jgi:pyranose oxidase
MTPRPGEHLKNAFIFQRNIDMFASVIRGHLNVMSVPSNRQEVMSLDSGAYRIDDDKVQGFRPQQPEPGSGSQQEPPRGGRQSRCQRVSKTSQTV